MGDFEQKYKNFWRWRLQRSSSSPSLPQKVRTRSLGENSSQSQPKAKDVTNGLIPLGTVKQRAQSFGQLTKRLSYADPAESTVQQEEPQSRLTRSSSYHGRRSDSSKRGEEPRRGGSLERNTRSSKSASQAEAQPKESSASGPGTSVNSEAVEEAQISTSINGEIHEINQTKNEVSSSTKTQNPNHSKGHALKEDLQTQNLRLSNVSGPVKATKTLSQPKESPSSHTIVTKTTSAPEKLNNMNPAILDHLSKHNDRVYTESVLQLRKNLAPQDSSLLQRPSSRLSYSTPSVTGSSPRAPGTHIPSSVIRGAPLQEYPSRPSSSQSNSNSYSDLPRLRGGSLPRSAYAMPPRSSPRTQNSRDFVDGGGPSKVRGNSLPRGFSMTPVSSLPRNFSMTPVSSLPRNFSTTPSSGYSHIGTQNYPVYGGSLRRSRENSLPRAQLFQGQNTPAGAPWPRTGSLPRNTQMSFRTPSTPRYTAGTSPSPNRPTNLPVKSWTKSPSAMQKQLKREQQPQQRQSRQQQQQEPQQQQLKTPKFQSSSRGLVQEPSSTAKARNIAGISPRDKSNLSPHVAHYPVSSTETLSPMTPASSQTLTPKSSACSTPEPSSSAIVKTPEHLDLTIVKTPDPKESATPSHTSSRKHATPKGRQNTPESQYVTPQGPRDPPGGRKKKTPTDLDAVLAEVKRASDMGQDKASKPIVRSELLSPRTATSQPLNTEAASKPLTPKATSQILPAMATSHTLPPTAKSELIPPTAKSEHSPSKAKPEHLPPTANSELLPPTASSMPLTPTTSHIVEVASRRSGPPRIEVQSISAVTRSPTDADAIAVTNKAGIRQSPESQVPPQEVPQTQALVVNPVPKPRRWSLAAPGSKTVAPRLPRQQPPSPSKPPVTASDTAIQTPTTLAPPPAAPRLSRSAPEPGTSRDRQAARQELEGWVVRRILTEEEPGGRRRPASVPPPQAPPRYYQNQLLPPGALRPWYPAPRPRAPSSYPPATGYGSLPPQQQAFLSSPRQYQPRSRYTISSPPALQEVVEDEVFHMTPMGVDVVDAGKTKSSSDSDHSAAGLRTASLDRLGRRGPQHHVAHAHSHAHAHTFTLPRRGANANRYSQPSSKNKGYGYSPVSSMFDEDPGIMSEAETSSTGFRRSSKQRSSMPIVRTPSSRTLDSRHMDMEDNASLWGDDDPGIMSEAETSSTGTRRSGLKNRSSLPIVRTPSKTLERPLGLVFLQYRGETKRALLPNEITSLDTVKALFVRSFPNQLSMQYLDNPNVKIYIHDSSKDMFYDMEDLRDIRDRSVLRVFEGEGVNGCGALGSSTAAPPSSASWDQDQSYFSEPEFDSEFQHQHVHKTKSGKGGGYYMTHSYPPGAPVQSTGVAPIPRGPPVRPPYSPEQMHADGYISSPERTPARPYGPYLTPTPSYEDPYYGAGGQYSSRSGSVTPIIDEEARSAFYSMRVEQMERQLASLTGLVQKALSSGVPGGAPRPDQLAAAAAAAAAAASQLPPPPPHPSGSSGAAVSTNATGGSSSSQRPPAAADASSTSSSDFLQVPQSSSSFKSSDSSFVRSDTKPPKLGRGRGNVVSH